MCYPRAGAAWKEGSQLVGRGELTEEAWRVIEPLLPANGRGGQWRDHRTGINGILWKLRTRGPVADVCGSARSRAARRDGGSPPGARANQTRCGGGDRLGGKYR